MREGLIHIDGSQGEGGGQILRSSLSLSICTQQPFKISNIRAKRDKPGLLRQHLTAVKAAAEISGATVTGAEIGSRELSFRPGPLQAGSYAFAIGSAGSCNLVLQTVLPPLLTAAGPSTVRITGGTHNKASPPFEFLQRVFLPLLARIGAQAVEMEFVQPVVGAREQEGAHFVALVVEHQRAPVEVLGLAQIAVFIERRSVEPGERVRIARKMRGHPVEDHADTGSVAPIDECLEIVG